MPRVRPLTREGKIEYQKVRLAEKCILIMRRNNITEAKIAEYLNVTRQSVSQRFRANNISLEILMAVVTLAKMDVGDLEVLKVE